MKDSGKFCIRAELSAFEELEDEEMDTEMGFVHHI